MDHIERGHKTIHLLYKDFKHYFKSGEILIGGSFYYKKIGCEAIASYKDVDLLIDENKDDILFEILNYYRSAKVWNEGSKKFEEIFNQVYKKDGILTGAFSLIDYASVDLIRDNFDNLLPQFEIIPGVWNYGLSDLAMFKAYERLEDSTDAAMEQRKGKYKTIKEFFQDRL